MINSPYSVNGFSESAMKLVASLRLQIWGLISDRGIFIFRIPERVSECRFWFDKPSVTGSICSERSNKLGIIRRRYLK